MQNTRLSLRRTVLSALAFAALSVTGLPTASAQDSYPSKPITIIVAGGAGGGADLLARAVGQSLSTSLKQPVVIDNRVGANGAIAAQAVIRAKPDGYTLLFGSASSTVINQAMQPKPTFDTVKDLAPIAPIGAGGVVLVTSTRFPAKDMREFMALVKANPGKYQYATWGVGTSGHLIMEWIKHMGGLDIAHVPYKSGPAIVQDMQVGVIDVAIMDTASALPQYKAGKLRVLGLSGTHKAPAMADVKLMSEQGVKFETNGWYGVFAPRGTPDAVLNLLNQEIRKAVTSPEMQQRLAQMNINLGDEKTASQFAQTVKDDLAVWQDIVKTNAIKLD